MFFSSSTACKLRITLHIYMGKVGVGWGGEGGLSQCRAYSSTLITLYFFSFLISFIIFLPVSTGTRVLPKHGSVETVGKFSIKWEYIYYIKFTMQCIQILVYIRRWISTNLNEACRLRHYVWFAGVLLTKTWAVTRVCESVGLKTGRN